MIIGPWYLIPPSANLGEIQALDDGTLVPAEDTLPFEGIKALPEFTKIGRCYGCRPILCELCLLDQTTDVLLDFIQPVVVVDSKLALQERESSELR